MMDARDDENRRYWHKKDLEEGIPSQFDSPPGEGPWPAPGKSTRPLGPFRDYAGELGLDPWMFDTLLDARIDRENRLRGPSQREMEEIEAEQHGWLPGLTPEEKLQSYQGAVERSNRYEPRDYWHDPTLPKTLPLARGGITGDDWHQPINRLPANYEGWVTQPSLATLGEAGKEAVLPLNKLLPAMNKGGLNYSPGQAIVGEAGPEYVTRLGPGEEQYAQSILREQPVPQMREGGVSGGEDGGGNYGWIKDIIRSMLTPQALASEGVGLGVGKVAGGGAGFLSSLFPLAAHYWDTEGAIRKPEQRRLLYDSSPYDSYLDRPPTEAMLREHSMSPNWPAPSTAEKPYGPGEKNPYAAQAYSNGQRVDWPSGISENQMFQGMGTGQFNNTPASRTLAPSGVQTTAPPEDPLELLRQMTLEEGAGDIDPRFLDWTYDTNSYGETPAFMGERTSEGDPRGYADPLWETDVSFQAASPKERIDLSLLDNDNARYWTTGEGSRRSPNRLYQMIRDLGYGDTREQVEKMKWNAKERNNEKWYRGGVAKPRPRPIPYPGVPPG
jgi:hypothetical protein